MQRTNLRAPGCGRASTYVDTDSQLVVNGDEPVSSDGRLRQFDDQMVGDKHTHRRP